MLTRCPECGTTFRVTPEQLKARSGRVRCGTCRRIFDALETLAEEPLPAPEAATALAESPAAVQARAEPAIEPLPEPLPPEPPSEPEPPPAPEPPRAPEPQPIPEPPALAEPDWPAAQSRRRPRIWPWAIGAGAALIALAAQAALHFRTEIAVLHPEARPLLLAACETLGCTLSRPRKPELVGIEASDLSIAADGRLALAATLRNRAPFAQEYPYLELTLTDTADRPLVRRVLAPAEYLPTQTPFAAGFGARADVAIHLAVAAAPEIAAAGYRLYLFYP